ncbi:MAG: uracil-DNA glycosylase [Clostridia bacterium]|nr:uracil-DNA glycosylase [Clostridia bacterium]MDD4375813.1 uracil-DNA glycosylase [Clostridia bacterium]
MSRFKEILDEEMKKDYMIKLQLFIDEEYKRTTIFPERKNIMNALSYTPYENVKVVIVGQDPYHGVDEAHGLCFSVKPGTKTPPSLLNMYKELNRDLNCYIPNNGYLVKWAKQGVLMLNSVLTVQKDKPGSHRGKGWEIFTDRIIEETNKKEEPVVFLLWGNYAKEKGKYITNTNHLILSTTHPSPFSVKRGFEGCSHFSKVNSFLKEKGIEPIDWQIENI